MKLSLFISAFMMFAGSAYAKDFNVTMSQYSFISDTGVYISYEAGTTDVAIHLAPANAEVASTLENLRAAATKSGKAVQFKVSGTVLKEAPGEGPHGIPNGRVLQFLTYGIAATK